MTTQTGSDYYQRGLELAEAGRYQEALNCMNEHLQAAPHDAQALNDAGAILHCLGRTNDAIVYLTRARNLNGDSGEIVWNLAEAYLAARLATETIALFDDMERMGIINVDVLNRTATMLLDQDKKGQAVEVLLRSYRLWPEQEVLRPILDVIRSKRPKVAFFRNGTGQDGALADVCTFVEQRFQTEFYEGLRPGGIAELMRWSDISWFDGGGEMAVEASRWGDCCKTIVSLRRSDVRSRWAKEVQWENVDILVQIGSSAVEESLLEQVPDIHNKTRLVVIPHGVNLSRYVFRRRGRGKHLACMGFLTMETNPAFLLQCMQKLHYVDPEYRLFFSGAFESPVLEQYTRHMVQTLELADVVSFEPCPHDLNAWLSDKHFIVAGGISESQVEALLMGMACGLKPVIHNFPGAEKLFPRGCLFNIAEHFCEQVLSGEYEPEEYRRFIEEHYAAQELLKKVNGILVQLEAEIDLQTSAVSGGGQAAASGARTQCVDGFAMPDAQGAINLS